MKRTLITIAICILFAGIARAQNVKVSPIGVNVNPNSGTTVFLTFGQVGPNLRPAEASWCGELIPATPALGLKCDPSTIFGSLPARYDLSQPSGTLGFTDVMSIPQSVARRAYQAAVEGADSRFFYVRRFASTGSGPDEYVIVTCRLASGGARTPFALTDVQLLFEPDLPIALVQPQTLPPTIKANIGYNGTGRLKGRWEVVMPGEEFPTDFDLLPEGSLPFEQRGTQRRYTQLARFNVFLPPVGRFTLQGPDPARLPSTIEGTYLVLLRIEASDDKEGDSNLAAVGAGPGIVHSGALAGFALPVLRYFVGKAKSRAAMPIELRAPADEATLNDVEPLTFAWTENRPGAFVRLEIYDANEKPVLNVLLPVRTESYRAPSWLRTKVNGENLRWRVVMFDEKGADIDASPWRGLRFGTSR